MMVLVLMSILSGKLQLIIFFHNVRMCEHRKIKNASSALTDNALVWWDNLCELINLDPGMT